MSIRERFSACIAKIRHEKDKYGSRKEVIKQIHALETRNEALAIANSAHMLRQSLDAELIRNLYEVTQRYERPAVGAVGAALNSASSPYSDTPFLDILNGRSG